MYDESRQGDDIAEPARVKKQSLKLNLRQYMLHDRKYLIPRISEEKVSGINYPERSNIQKANLSSK